MEWLWELNSFLFHTIQNRSASELDALRKHFLRLNLTLSTSWEVAWLNVLGYSHLHPLAFITNCIYLVYFN